jgi:NAD(P)-dependent dehydrogenase (short-subunit alcohol dehydrogenase family)
MEGLNGRRDVDLELGGSRVLVTGGSDGVGLSLAAALLAEGARVAICGRDPERLATAVEALDGGEDLLGLRCDVTDPVQLAELSSAVLGRFGGLEGLVNNAGRSTAKPVTETTDEDWNEDLDLKLLSVVRLTRLLVPALASSGRGSIVNVLAIQGKAPGAATTPTSVSRAAGLALTKAMSFDLGPQGIRANALLIGFIESSQWIRQAAAAKVSAEDFYAGLVAGSQIPLGRVGRAEEFADVASFLLSSRSSYVTGAGINVDGGKSPVW